MRCYICDRVIDEPEFNRDHQDIEPCKACRAVIEDILAGYGDRPSIPDEDGDVLIIEGLYPTIDDPFQTETE